MCGEGFMAFKRLTFSIIFCQVMAMGHVVGRCVCLGACMCAYVCVCRYGLDMLNVYCFVISFSLHTFLECS